MRRNKKLADGNSATKEIKELSLVLSSIDDEKLIARFLVSILTRNEIGDLSSRWSLVNLLSCGVSQREIAKRLGISLCKITRGSRELKKKNSALKRFVDEHKRALNRRSENRSTKEKKQCL